MTTKSQNITQEHVVLEQYAPQRSISSTYGSISGTYPFKGTGGVRFESMLERDFLARLQTYPNVLNVTSQPLTLQFTAKNGGVYSYTPDYLINYKSYPHNFRKSEIIEVKPRSKLIKQLLKDRGKYQAAFRYCNENDLVFRFMDELRIRDQRWKNANFLQRYKKRSFDETVSTEILNGLVQMGTSTFDHLLTRYFYTAESKALGISHLWHLVSIGKISCDLSLPLSAFTELWILENDFK